MCVVVVIVVLVVWPRSLSSLKGSVTSAPSPSASHVSSPSMGSGFSRITESRWMDLKKGNSIKRESESAAAANFEVGLRVS